MIMNRTLVLLCLGLLASPAIGFSQDESPQNMPATGSGRGRRGGGAFSREAFDVADTNSALPRFDLDFPGGRPIDLVLAIDKASRKPINAIIPGEYKDTELPPLKMKEVTVPQLFQALTAASRRNVAVPTGSNFGGGGFGAGGRGGLTFVYQNVAYGFKTEGAIKEDSIWYFYCDEPGKPPMPEERAAAPRVCRFFQLGRFLEKGYKVDDITTAIETGWKMLGMKDRPEMTYHKDTKLLIAVGEPEKLQLIDAALVALSQETPPSAADRPARSPGRLDGTNSPNPSAASRNVRF